MNCYDMHEILNHINHNEEGGIIKTVQVVQ